MIEGIVLLLIGGMNAYILNRMDKMDKIVNDTNRKVDAMISNARKRLDD